MFVSALRVLSSSRKYTSFCLVFLGVLKILLEMIMITYGI